MLNLCPEYETHFLIYKFFKKRIKNHVGWMKSGQKTLFSYSPVQSLTTVVWFSYALTICMLVS
jgi:hypothetical protein